VQAPDTSPIGEASRAGESTGIGAECAFAPHWTARAEYPCATFTSADFPSFPSCAVTACFPSLGV
jgi:hypothetical protein